TSEYMCLEQLWARGCVPRECRARVASHASGRYEPALYVTLSEGEALADALGNFGIGRCERRYPLALADRNVLLRLDGFASFGNDDAQHAFVEIGCDVFLRGAMRQPERPVGRTA